MTRFNKNKGYVQLPPHTRTADSLPASRFICRLFSEKRASHAVVDAKGTVAASAAEMDRSNRKLICSLAMECWLYAPSPLTSPASISILGRAIDCFEVLTTPH